MTTQFAGAIEIEPALTGPEVASVRRLAEGGSASMPWAVSRDGTTLRPQGDVDIETATETLRLLVGRMQRRGRFRGTVAAYDADARELVAITVANGRVTRRRLRGSRSAGARSNVIDLATRRNAVSRIIG